MKQLLELKEQVNGLEELLVSINKQYEDRINAIENRFNAQITAMQAMIADYKKDR